MVPGFAPGEHPAAELARSLSRAVAEQRLDPRGIDVESQLGHGSSSGLVDLALRLCDGSSGRRSGGPLLFIDQAEELITRTASAERAAFLQLLRGALHADSPVWVVATLRSEFLGRFLVLPEGADTFDDTYPVGPLASRRR